MNTRQKNWELEQHEDSQSSPAHLSPSTWQPLHYIQPHSQARMWTDPIHSRLMEEAAARERALNANSWLRGNVSSPHLADYGASTGTGPFNSHSPRLAKQPSPSPVNHTRHNPHLYPHTSSKSRGNAEANHLPISVRPLYPRGPTTATEAMAAAVSRDATEKSGMPQPLPSPMMAHLTTQPSRRQRMNQIMLEPTPITPVITNELDESDLGPYMVPRPMDMAPKLLTLDDYNLMSLGYKPVLARRLAGASLAGAGMAAANILTGILPLYGEALMNGGPAWATWSFFTTGIMAIVVNLSLSELASAYPTAAGVHHWVYQLGSSRHRAFLTWMTGWLSIISAISVTSCVGYYFSTVLGQLLFTNYGTSMTPAIVVLLYLGVHVLWGFLNILPISVTSVMFSSSGALQLGLTVTVASVLLSLTKLDANSMHVPFTATINYSGSSSSIYAAISTLLMSAFVFQTNDTVVRFSEECRRPERALPRALISNAVLSLLVGFMLVVALSYGALHPIHGLLEEPVPAAKIIMVVVGPSARSTVMGFILVSFFFTGLSRLSVATRVLYSLSRDGGLPKSSYWNHLHPRRRIPQRIAWLVLSASASTIFPFFWGNTRAYDWIGSTAIIATNMTYALPLLLRLTSEGQLHYIPGTFTLGVFSKPVAAVSLLWLLGVSGLIMLPRTFPLTKNNFNYSSIALVSMLFLFGLSWFRARTDFTGGPKIDSRASHHKAPSEDIGDGSGGGDNHRNINSKHGRGTSRNRVISHADSYVSVQHRELNPQRNTNRPMELVSLETLHRLRAKAARQRAPPPQSQPLPPLGSRAGAAVERQGKPMSAFNTQKGVSSPQPAGRAKKQGKRVLEKESQRLYHREGNKPPPLDMAGVMSGKKGENAMTGLSTGESARSVATSSILGIPLSESPEMMHQELPDVHPADLSAADSVMEMNAFEQEHTGSDGRALLHQFDSASAPSAPRPEPSSHERKDDHDHDHSVMATYSSPTTSCPNLTNTNGSTPISSSPGIPLSIAKESLMLTQPFPTLPAESYSRKSNGSSSNVSHSPQLSFPQSLHVTPVIPSIEIAPATTISSQESRSLGTDSSSSIGNSPLVSHGKHEFNEAPSPFTKHQHQHQQYNVTSPATATTVEPPTNVTLERNYKQARDPQPDAFAAQSIMATSSSQQGYYTRNIVHDSSPPELCDCGALRAPNAAPTNHHPTRSDDQGGQLSKEGEADTSSDEYHYTVDIGRRSTRARAALESIRQIKLPESGNSANPRPAPPPTTTLFQSRIPRPIKGPPPSPFPSLPSSNMLPSPQSFGNLAESTLSRVGFRSVKGRIPTPYPSSLADQDESSIPETHTRSSVSIDRWEIQEHDLLLQTSATQPQHDSSNERKAMSTLHLPTIHKRSKRSQVDQEDNTTVSTLTLEQATDDLQIKERPSPLPHLQTSHSLLSPTSAASKLPAYPTHPTSKLALGENSHADSTRVSKEVQKHNEGDQSERQVKRQYGSQLPAVPPTASARKKQDKNKKRPLPINTSLAMSPPPHTGHALDVEDYKRIATRKLDRHHHQPHDPLSAKGVLSSDTSPFQGRTSTAQDPLSQHQLHSLHDSAREGRSRSQQHLEYVQHIHSRPLPSSPPHEHHHYSRTIRASEARDTDRHNRRHHAYHQEGDADADADADADDDDDDDNSVNATHTCAQFQALESERDMYRQKRRTVADWTREQSRIQEKRERRRARARAARAAAAFAAVRQRLESQSAPSMDHLAFRSQSPPPVVAAAVAATGRHHRITKRAEEEAAVQSVMEETASLDSSSSSLSSTSSLSSGSEGKGGAMWTLSSHHHHYPHRHEPYQLHHHHQRRHRHHTQSTRQQQQWQPLPKSLHHLPSNGKHERQQHHTEEAREGKHSQHEISSPTSDTHPTTTILTGTLNAPNTIQANPEPDNVHVGRRPSNPNQEKKEREERDDERSSRGIQDEVYEDGSYDSDPSKNTAYHVGEFDPSGSHAMRRSYQPSVDTESLGAGVGRA